MVNPKSTAFTFESFFAERPVIFKGQFIQNKVYILGKHRLCICTAVHYLFSAYCFIDICECFRLFIHAFSVSC